MFTDFLVRRGRGDTFYSEILTVEKNSVKVWSFEEGNLLQKYNLGIHKPIVSAIYANNIITLVLEDGLIIKLDENVQIISLFYQ